MPACNCSSNVNSFVPELSTRNNLNGYDYYMSNNTSKITNDNIPYYKILFIVLAIIFLIVLIRQKQKS